MTTPLSLEELDKYQRGIFVSVDQQERLIDQAKRAVELEAENARLREALERAKHEFWNKCYAGSGEVQAMTVQEFDAFIDAALAGEEGKG